MFTESGSIQKVQTPPACGNFLNNYMSTCEGGVLQKLQNSQGGNNNAFYYHKHFERFSNKWFHGNDRTVMVL